VDYGQTAVISGGIRLRGIRFCRVRSSGLGRPCWSSAACDKHQGERQRDPRRHVCTPAIGAPHDTSGDLAQISSAKLEPQRAAPHFVSTDCDAARRILRIWKKNLLLVASKGAESVQRVWPLKKS
jgi:hypothetical protein